jgi:acyl-CoA hydrolase
MPQDRNVHGKIFGGYIMKKAFEIAHVAAVRIDMRLVKSVDRM